MLIDGANVKPFEAFRLDLANCLTMGTIQYPTTLNKAYRMLRDWKSDHTDRPRKPGQNNDRDPNPNNERNSSDRPSPGDDTSTSNSTISTRPAPGRATGFLHNMVGHQ